MQNQENIAALQNINQRVEDKVGGISEIRNQESKQEAQQEYHTKCQLLHNHQQHYSAYPDQMSFRQTQKQQEQSVSHYNYQDTNYHQTAQHTIPISTNLADLHINNVIHQYPHSHTDQHAHNNNNNNNNYNNNNNNYINKTDQKINNFSNQDTNLYSDQHFIHVINQNVNNVNNFSHKLDSNINEQHSNHVNNVASQPCQTMQKDLQNSLSGKNGGNQSYNTQNSQSQNSCAMNGGINSQQYVSEQQQQQGQTTTKTEEHSYHGYQSTSILQPNTAILDDTNVIVNNGYLTNNPHHLFIQNHSLYNSKSLEASNYNYRNGQTIECPRIEYSQPSCNPISIQNAIQSNVYPNNMQLQRLDVNPIEEQRFYSKNYDSILENLGKKIENIAKIAKESEKHEMEIKKYISNENSLEYLLTSPQMKQVIHDSESKDLSLFQDTDKNNNSDNNNLLLTNRSNYSHTNRTHGKSITTLYNLNNTNLQSANLIRHNSSTSLPLTERDPTFAIQQHTDLPFQHSISRKDDMIRNISNNFKNKLTLQSDGQDESRVNSSRAHYKEYPSVMMMITEKNNNGNEEQNNNGNEDNKVKKKGTDLQQVSKRLEDLLKYEGDDSDYVFYNGSVYQQCPHIYSQAEYIIFTSSDFENLMTSSTTQSETVLQQQKKILKLEESIQSMKKKEDTLIQYQKEIIAKNNSLSEHNATLLRTLANISSEKTTTTAAQLKEGYKLQQFQQQQQQNLQYSLKKSDLSCSSSCQISDIKQTSQPISQTQQEQRQVKLSVLGQNKENNLKVHNISHNCSEQQMNKSANCSQTTTQLHTPNTKGQGQKAAHISSAVAATSHGGSKGAVTQSKRQNACISNVMGESQYFSKESSNTFNTEHYNSCDIEENKSTEPANAESMRQKTEEEEENEDEEETIIGGNMFQSRSSGSLANAANQRNLHNQSLNNLPSSHSLSQMVLNQNDSQSVLSTAYLNSSNHQDTRPITLLPSYSGTNILIKNKPPIQPKQQQKGTILIKDFLQQDIQTYNQNNSHQGQRHNQNYDQKPQQNNNDCQQQNQRNNDQKQNEIYNYLQQKENIMNNNEQQNENEMKNDYQQNENRMSRHLNRLNSSEVDKTNNSHVISSVSMERQSIDNKKISATKMLKSKIIMNQQNSQESIQKQLQEKQHHLVEQLQSLTKADDTAATATATITPNSTNYTKVSTTASTTTTTAAVNTKLSSTNIQQLNYNNNNSQSQQNVISGLTNGLQINNNHILKISPSFLKNKVSQPPSSSNASQSTSTHSKSIDSYSMQSTKKPFQESTPSAVSSQSPFTQNVRASVLAGKTATQSHSIMQSNTTDKIIIPESERTNPQKKEQSTQKLNLKQNSKTSKQDNIKMSNLNSMNNYHLSGTIGNNNNNSNRIDQNSHSSVTYGSSQQNLSIDEFSSTSSRGKKGLQQPSSFYLAGGVHTHEQTQLLSQNRMPPKGSNGSAPITSFSQQMHTSSQGNSFMNNDSVIPTVNKTTLNKQDTNIIVEPNSHASVTHDSNKSNGSQQSQSNQSQKIGHTTLLLKQITKSQPHQHSLNHQQSSQQNTQQSSSSSNPQNNSSNNQQSCSSNNKSIISTNNSTATTTITTTTIQSSNQKNLPPQKFISYSLDKAQGTSSNNNQTQQKNPNTQYNFKLSLSNSQNKPDHSQLNLNANNQRVAPHQVSHVAQVNPNPEKKKSGSLTQRGSDNDQQPFDLKAHILQNQRDRNDKLILIPQRQDIQKKAENKEEEEEKRGLEKRTKHTNSVPHFSSLSIAQKAQTARGVNSNIASGIDSNHAAKQKQNISEIKPSQIRPSSLNQTQQRHFTSLNDQNDQNDQTQKSSQYFQDQRQQIMTERIERGNLENLKHLQSQSQNRFRTLSKQQGNSAAEVDDNLRDLRNDQECNIF